MVIETLKLGILFILVFIVMRMLGKTLLSQWTAYDLVTIIFLSYAALAAVKVHSFFHAVICIVLIGFLYLTLSKLSLYGIFSRFIIGEPTIIIKHGKISQKNLKKVRYSLTELLSTVRAFGYPDVQDIEYAILEPNGKISIIPRKELKPLTPKLMKIDVEYTGLPLAIIVDGSVQLENLTLIEKSEEWLKNELENNGYHHYRDIFYAYIKDNDKSISIVPYQS
ncbi:DUF421 domain-containing protein [Alkalihalobacillus sp. BA299]|uniref:DUF421 domain-containing protein n=1 Tax=Alkalihalobacillus sp. BA299 TaxID=2815938 RepID=UPI001AD96CBA|nr:DUF421 domain-containing protein [Alkalihalobacillus sp. BA299]